MIRSFVNRATFFQENEDQRWVRKPLYLYFQGFLIMRSKHYHMPNLMGISTNFDDLFLRRFVLECIQLIGSIFRNSVLQHWWLFELQSKFFWFPAKCNNWGRPFKTHHITEKLVHIVKKNKVHQNPFWFFVASQNWLCYQLIKFWREI